MKPGKIGAKLKNKIAEKIKTSSLDVDKLKDKVNLPF